MRTEPEDRLHQPEKKRVSAMHVILVVVGIIGIAAAVYYPGMQKESLPVEEAPMTVTRTAEPAFAPAVPPTPDIPEQQPTTEPATQERPVEAPVSLVSSDQDLRELLSPMNGSVLVTQFLRNDHLIQRGAGLIDGFSQGLAPRKLLEMSPPTKKFSTVIVNEQIQVDPASYSRYNTYAKAISGLDMELLVRVFHRYRTLIEQAYKEFGYAADDMDNAVIRALDYILATPVLAQPAALKKKEAVYEYVDPALEQLTPLQKQVLRMGPENSAMLKQQVEKLRNGLLGVSSNRR